MKTLIFALLLALAFAEDQDMEMEQMEKEQIMDILAPRLMDILMKMKYMDMAEKMKEGKSTNNGLCPKVVCGLCLGGPESPFGNIGNLFVYIHMYVGAIYYCLRPLMRL